MTCEEYCHTCCKSDVCSKRSILVKYGDMCNEVLKNIQADGTDIFPQSMDFITNDIRCKHYHPIDNTRIGQFKR